MVRLRASLESVDDFPEEEGQQRHSARSGGRSVASSPICSFGMPEASAGEKTIEVA